MIWRSYLWRRNGLVLQDYKGASQGVIAMLTAGLAAILARGAAAAGLTHHVKVSNGSPQGEVRRSIRFWSTEVGVVRLDQTGQLTDCGRSVRPEVGEPYGPWRRNT